MILIILDEWEEWGNVDASKYVNDDDTIKFPLIRKGKNENSNNKEGPDT